MSYAAKFQQPNHTAPYERQAFHKPHTSMGTAGHWIKTLGILSPVVIGELVADTKKQLKYIRLASVGTALLSEACWSYKIHKEREDAHEREVTCHSQG
jgi:hypothetical protein